jgi:IS30 family transposase
MLSVPRFSPRGKTGDAQRAKKVILSLGCNTQNKMAQLTLEQRYKIEAWLEAGKSRGQIAQFISKDKSVVSREIKRNSDGRNGQYKADLAHRKAQNRHKLKPKKRRFNAEVEANVLYYLTMDYSPEQISGRAAKDSREMVSTERIYQYIWEDKRKGGKLHQYLRTKGKRYAKRGQAKGRRGQIPGRVGIEHRPEGVERKERFGDLEIDLVVGKGHKQALLTINDRATGMLFMDKVESKEAERIEEKTVELLRDWIPLIHTMTSDNGKEFARHQNIAEKLTIDFYFALPYHSWQRGANENLNGLVRQYFPKDMDFRTIDKAQIQQVVQTLNNRPRKRFGFLSPNEMLAQTLDQQLDVAFIT